MNNNITEDYCSFEVSKLLKDKGYNILPENTIKTDYVFGYISEEEDDSEFTFKVVEFKWEDSVQSHKFLRPTHALAIKWIRENVSFTDIWVEPYLSEEPKQYTPCIWNRGEYIRLNPENYFKSAESAALLYTLQNLIK